LNDKEFQEELQKNLCKIKKIRKISDSAINLRILGRNSESDQKPKVFDNAGSSGFFLIIMIS